MIGPYELNTVVAGDCLDVMAQMPENSVDMIITSPPYYNAREYSHWDTYEAYVADLNRWMQACFRVLKPGRRMAWNVDDLLKSAEKFHNCTPSIDSVIAAKSSGFSVKTVVIWDDPMNAEGWRPGTGHNGPGVVINYSIEYVWVFQKPRGETNHHWKHDPIPKELEKYNWMDNDFLAKFARKQVWTIPSERQPDHPAPFPEALVEPCIRMWSLPGWLVFDPFMGSGTTAISAMKWKRDFFGCDQLPQYVRLAQARIRQRSMELLTNQMFLPEPVPSNRRRLRQSALLKA